MTDADKASLLEDLRVKHGKILVVEDEDFGLVVFRRPTKLEFRGYKADREDDTRKAAADEMFAAKVVVHPSPTEFNTLLDTFPVLATNIAGQAMSAAGGSKLEVKKL